MADLDHIVGIRLVSVIDDREWDSTAAAKRLRETAGSEFDRSGYAHLFDTAAEFWRELGLVVESGRVPTNEQAFALRVLRDPIETDVIAQMNAAEQSTEGSHRVH